MAVFSVVANLQETDDIRNGRGMALVFCARVLWPTIGLGIRFIEAATVWQILLYRSASLVFSLRGDVCALRPEPIATSLSCGLSGLRCRAGPCGRLFRRHLRDPDNYRCKGDAVVCSGPVSGCYLGLDISK